MEAVMITGAVAAAIRMERDAITFYEASSNRARHAFGREMFKGFKLKALTLKRMTIFRY